MNIERDRGIALHGIISGLIVSPSFIMVARTQSIGWILITIALFALCAFDMHRRFM